MFLPIGIAVIASLVGISCFTPPIYGGFKNLPCPGIGCPRPPPPPPPPPYRPLEIYCSPVSCWSPCISIKDSDTGCPTCFCPPIKPVCPTKTLICQPGCMVKINGMGCKYCHCNPICPPLSCPGVCFVRHVAGRCPFCQCPQRIY